MISQFSDIKLSEFRMSITYIYIKEFCLNIDDS